MLRIFKKYYPARNIIFIIGEGLFIYASVMVAGWLILGTEALFVIKMLTLKAALIAFVCQICLYFNDLYDLKITDTFGELFIRLFQALGAASIIFAGIYFVFPGIIIGNGIFIVSIGFVIVLIVSWRFCYAGILKKGFFDQNIIILGTSDLAGNIIKEIEGRKDCGYKVKAVVSKQKNNQKYVADNTSFFFKPNFIGLCEMTKEFNTKKIVVALREKRGALPVKELIKCRVKGINVMEGNTFYEMLTGKLIVEEINPGWLIFQEGFYKSSALRYVKRIVDIILSSSMLLILTPFLMIVALIIKLDSKGTVFFSQERVGEKKKSYMVHKFRSMKIDAEKSSGPVWAQTDDDRVTRVGRFIRKWRIDEFPQLWNVLKGEMSFVGPRPERDYFVRELEEKIPYYAERFTVKPGLTGWAQVSYGYGASVADAAEKLNYDLFYIKNLTFLMDIMIIMRTVKTVIFGHGAR